VRTPQERCSDLLIAYQIARDDERNLLLVLAALFTLSGTLVFAEATQLFPSGPRQHVAGLIYLLAPAPVFGVLALYVLAGAEATVRYGYLIAVEHELRELGAGGELGVLRIPTFSFERARLGLVISQKPRLRFPFPSLLFVAAAAVIVVVTALAGVCVQHRGSTAANVIAACVYAMVAGWLVWCACVAWSFTGLERTIWPASEKWFDERGRPTSWR
jgi:hypothetical protein